MVVESAKERGPEAVVANYAGAPYQGGRTSLWRKLVLRRPEKGWGVEERKPAGVRFRCPAAVHRACTHTP